MTHLFKLVDKMCKYEMDLASIVDDTVYTMWSIDGRWTDRQTDGQTDGQSETSIPPQPTSLVGVWLHKSPAISTFIVKYPHYLDLRLATTPSPWSFSFKRQLLWQYIIYAQHNKQLWQ